MADYWDLARWALLVIGLAFLILAIPMRRPGKAFGVLLLGVYATAAWFFMTRSDEFGLGAETAIALVVVVGLVVLGIFYYVVLIRSG